jgi:hypothetical protein
MLLRPSGYDGNGQERTIVPGDLLAGGENILSGAIATVGAGVWTGAAIATGIIRRTGSTAAYTDTTDTAANIIAALSGNSPSLNVLPGQSFRLLVQNTVAFALTFAAGVGVNPGIGTGTLNIAASLAREYLVTILNTTPVQMWQMTLTNASPNALFVLPPGAVALKFPVDGGSGPSMTPGALISDAGNTNIPANTTVLGFIQGQGGITGVVMSANASATVASPGEAVTFGPVVQMDGLRTSTL